MSIILQHPSLLYLQDIKDICQPLTKLGITYFAHVKIDNQNQFSAISNNAAFTEHYLKNKYYNADIHMAESKFKNEFIIWDALKSYGESARMDEESVAFGIQHTFSLVDANDKEKNYYHFAVNKRFPEINQVYLENRDLLKLFVLHFQEEVSQSKLLSAAYQLKFSIEENASHFLIKPDHEYMILQRKRQSFINSINQKKNINSSIHDNSSFVLKENVSFRNILSKRELDCLLLSIRGKTAKQVAAELGISKRTVEEYIDNIKLKLCVTTKSELINKTIEIILSQK